MFVGTKRVTARSQAKCNWTINLQTFVQDLDRRMRQIENRRLYEIQLHDFRESMRMAVLKLKRRVSQLENSQPY